MNIKLSKKIIIPIIFIIILAILTIIISYKVNNKNEIEHMLIVNAEDIIVNNSYDFVNDKIRIIQEEQLCSKEDCNKVCNYVTLPQDFVFDTQEKIRDYIEEFFILYLNLLDIGCINNKIKQFMGPDLSVGKIFKLKNLSLNDFSPLTYILIDNLYFANSIVIDEIKLNNYGLFKLVKNKFDAKLINYKYYYNSTLNSITLVKNTIKPEMEELLIKNVSSEDSNIVLRDILECTESKCTINMKSLYFYDIIKRLNKYPNINFNKIRDDIGLNLTNLIELCQNSIIFDLFLKYNNINKLNELSKNNVSMNVYNTIIQNIFTKINNIKSTNYNNNDFKEYLSLDALNNII